MAPQGKKNIEERGAEGANHLYPIFLKTSQLNILIVGGGSVAAEKLHFLLKSSPDACVTLVAPKFKKEVLSLTIPNKVVCVEDEYNKNYINGKHIVIATTNSETVNLQVHNDCRKQNILINVADNPPYCDFYMGGIVTKGHVKVAISTNGKSPTTAKRLRQFFEDVIPEDIDDLVKNLNAYRKTIKGNFQQKVETLNQVTKQLIEKQSKKVQHD
ncbi:MAG: bifunctional precorrin-2 dehydrogenase/sirohydrochlorin ferrochelatase [Flavobacteriaceae bacterium]